MINIRRSQKQNNFYNLHFRTFWVWFPSQVQVWHYLTLVTGKEGLKGIFTNILIAIYRFCLQRKIKFSRMRTVETIILQRKVAGFWQYLWKGHKSGRYENIWDKQTWQGNDMRTRDWRQKVLKFMKTKCPFGSELWQALRNIGSKYGIGKDMIYCPEVENDSL